MAEGGHIALAKGGQFTLVLGGQFVWIFQLDQPLEYDVDPAPLFKKMGDWYYYNFIIRRNL